VTEEQEQWLGDAQADQQEPFYRLLPQDDSQELQRLGEKLLSELPAKTIRYRFRVFDSSEANAFSFAGGHIYVSRKLIVGAKSEDELAAVLAHEISHIYTRQFGVELSRLLRDVGHFTSFTDKADLEDKYQRLLNMTWGEKARLSEDEQERNELIADRVAFYLLLRAGYAPSALAEILDRVSLNNHRTGNLLTDLLGVTPEISLRVRVARHMLESIPAACSHPQPLSSESFRALQRMLRNGPPPRTADSSPQVASFKLSPPIRPDLSQVRFSPDGRYILAQDASAIHVIRREPPGIIFSIAAPDAEPAAFSPDSQHIGFYYANLRIERWSLASATREWYRELTAGAPCSQTSLSPDSGTFVCLAETADGVWLQLIDVESGKELLNDREFYLPSSKTQPMVVVRSFLSNPALATVAYSQDGRYLLVTSGVRAMAWDLMERRKIALGQGFNSLTQGRTAFFNSRNIVFDCTWSSSGVVLRGTSTFCVSTFPDGRLQHRFALGDQWVAPVARGNHILAGPFRDAAARLVDPLSGRVDARLKASSVDLFDDIVASENEEGELSLGNIGGSTVQTISLPPESYLSTARAVFSPDGRYLAVSGSGRSSIWDLKIGRQMALLRPFRGAQFEASDQLLAQFQESNLQPGKNVRIDLALGKITETASYATGQMQYGAALVSFESTNKQRVSDDDVLLHVSSPTDGHELWSRRFRTGRPSFECVDGNLLLLAMDMRSEAAENEISHARPPVERTSDYSKQWLPSGMLFEVVDTASGRVLRKLMTPAPAADDPSRDQRSGALYGDFLVVFGNSNSSVIYRVSDGRRLGAFFGRVVSGDSSLGLLAATNRENEVILIDAATGKRLETFEVNGFPHAARFVASQGELVVFTANQTVYRLRLPTRRQ
jgi:WD40 repeat protein